MEKSEKVEESGLKPLQASLGGMIDRYVKQQARDTITQNAAKDKAEVRYARVPSATESYANGCPFCLMLASRGFVYYNEQTAGGKSKMKAFGAYHDDCNCQPVPAFDTYVVDSHGRRLAADVEIDGYDPTELYGYYLENIKGRYGGSNSKIFSGKNAKTYPQDKSPFGSIYEMGEFLKEAISMDDLKQRCAKVEKCWNSNVYPDKYWISLQSTVADMKRQLAA